MTTAKDKERPSFLSKSRSVSTNIRLILIINSQISKSKQFRLYSLKEFTKELSLKESN